ncbi:MAG: hypothetical protein A3H98_03765 [Bacteroidetes bacterium RIFCSPLOWO2_02_FULL_36_8]|nr:MAG: hypothetical protein A3H98_03765 [Bacteroidetes bacterium RIFCSPLOWO2_02_FULL_36_8]OFY70381.1 MAG: hypothetical protein A3G23_09650 [Bacteroidetes bacterium RIFCSPLOWO2_12_FULL_37_12]
MIKKFLNITKYLLLLGLAVWMMMLSFEGLEFSKFKEDLQHAEFSWILLSIFIGILAHIVRSLRWQLLLAPMEHHPNFWNTFHALLIGYFANLAFPRMGEITRCAILTKTDKIPVTESAGTVLVERTIDFLCLVGITLFVFMVELPKEHSFVTEVIYQAAVKLKNIFSNPLVLLISLVVVIAGISIIFYILKKGKEGNSFFRKTTTMLKGFWKGISSIGKMKRKWTFLLYTFAIWFLYFLMTYVALFALPFIENLGLYKALVVLVVGSVGMVIPVQGGIGAFHYFVKQTLVFYGISQEDGLVYATLLHGSQMILVIVLGLIGLGVVFLRKTKSVSETNAKEPAS